MRVAGLVLGVLIDTKITGSQSTDDYVLRKLLWDIGFHPLGVSFYRIIAAGPECLTIAVSGGGRGALLFGLRLLLRQTPLSLVGARNSVPMAFNSLSKPVEFLGIRRGLQLDEGRARLAPFFVTLRADRTLV